MTPSNFSRVTSSPPGLRQAYREGGTTAVLPVTHMLRTLLTLPLLYKAIN